MTPPKESSQESASGDKPVLQNPASRDLFSELKNLRRQDGIYDDGDRKIPITDEDKSDLPLQPREPTEVPVHIRTKPQVEPKDTSQLDAFLGVQADQNSPIDRVRDEIAAEIPEEQPINSLAQRQIERQTIPLEKAQIPQKLTLAEVRDTIAGARSVTELKHRVEPHVAEYNLVAGPDGWYRAMPGNNEARLILEVINQERNALEKRGTIERARHATGRAFDTLNDVRQVMRERDDLRKDAVSANLEEKARRSEAVVADVAENKMWDEAIADNAAHDAQMEKQAADKALVGPDGFDGFVQQEINKVTGPIDADISRVESIQSRLMAASDRMPLHDRKELETENAHELNALHKKRRSEKEAVIKKTAEDRKRLTQEMREHAAGIANFEVNLKTDVYKYMPDADMHPEMVAILAGINRNLVNSETVPVKVDDYDIDNGKGKHSTRMQRLVYRTDNPSLFVVEDWDKTSGKLKRQSFVKGTDVLVQAKENGLGRLHRGRKETELSNKVYQKLGPIESTSVVSDSDTSSVDGYNSHVRNLTRSGGVNLNKARELADPTRTKNKRTESFIQMLTKNLAKAANRK